MTKFLTSYVKKYPLLFVCIAYALLTIVFTFPLITHFGSQIPKGGGDVYQVLSSIDNGVSQIKTLDFAHKFIFLSKKINVFTPYILFNLFLNKFVAYNLLFLLTYFLSALGMFLLTRYFVKNNWASFLAGIIYAFSPFHFYQSVSVHLGTMQQQWIPFFVLFLFMFFDKLRFKYFVGLCFFAFLIAMAEHQMLAFTVLFTAMVAGYKIAMDRSILKSKRFWCYVVGSLGLLAVVAVVMFGDMLKVATSNNNFLDAGANAANRYSILLLDPFAPPIFHSLWPAASEFLQKIILGGTNRGSYFLGFSVLGVLVYFAYLLSEKRVVEVQETQYRRDLVFWSGSSLLFYIFSLGNYFSIGKMTIYLPYFLIYKFLPFYENIRTTGRMFVFTQLGIAMLFAFGYAQIQKKYLQKKILLGSVFAVLILLEFWVAPIGTMVVSYSPFYDQLAKDKEAYKLIEIPGSTSYEFASYAMFTASVHGKTDLNGMPLARKISGEFDMQQGTPVIKQLLYTIPKGNDPETKDSSDIIAPVDWNLATDILNYYGVRYVTISKSYTDKDVFDLAEKFVQAHITFANKYEDSYLVAYQVAQKNPTGFYAKLNDSSDNFYSSSFVSADGKRYREMGDGGGINVVNMGSAPQQLKVTVTAKGAAGITISSPADLQSNMLVLEDNSKQYSFLVSAQPGNNIFNFSIKDANGKAVTISNSKKKPTGALISAISVQAVQ